MASDEELEAIRKKKLLEMQQQQIMSQAAAEDEQRQELEEQKKSILRMILTAEARERLGRIKTARPDIVENIENQLIMLAQSGRLKNKISDEQLQDLLSKLLPRKREIKIKKRGI